MPGRASEPSACVGTNDNGASTSAAPNTSGLDCAAATDASALLDDAVAEPQ